MCFWCMPLQVIQLKQRGGKKINPVYVTRSQPTDMFNLSLFQAKTGTSASSGCSSEPQPSNRSHLFFYKIILFFSVFFLNITVRRDCLTHMRPWVKQRTLGSGISACLHESVSLSGRGMTTNHQSNAGKSSLSLLHRKKLRIYVIFFFS